MIMINNQVLVMIMIRLYHILNILVIMTRLDLNTAKVRSDALLSLANEYVGDDEVSMIIDDGNATGDNDEVNMIIDDSRNTDDVIINDDDNSNSHANPEGEFINQLPPKNLHGNACIKFDEESGHHVVRLRNPVTGKLGKPFIKQFGTMKE